MRDNQQQQLHTERTFVMKPKQRKTRCQNEPSRVNDVVNDQRSRSIFLLLLLRLWGPTAHERNKTKRGDVNVAVVAVEFMSPQS